MLIDPPTAESPGDQLILIVPAGPAVFGDNLVAGPGRQVDRDVVLIGRQYTIVVHQFLGVVQAWEPRPKSSVFSVF